MADHGSVAGKVGPGEIVEVLLVALELTMLNLDEFDRPGPTSSAVTGSDSAKVGSPHVSGGAFPGIGPRRFSAAAFAMACAVAAAASIGWIHSEVVRSDADQRAEDLARRLDSAEAQGANARDRLTALYSKHSTTLKANAFHKPRLSSPDIKSISGIPDGETLSAPLYLDVAVDNAFYLTRGINTEIAVVALSPSGNDPTSTSFVLSLDSNTERLEKQLDLGPVELHPGDDGLWTIRFYEKKRLLKEFRVALE